MGDTGNPSSVLPPLPHNLLLPAYSFYLLTISHVCVTTGFGAPDGFSFGLQKSGQRRGGEGWTQVLCLFSPRSRRKAADIRNVCGDVCAQHTSPGHARARLGRPGPGQSRAVPGCAAPWSGRLPRRRAGSSNLAPTETLDNLFLLLLFPIVIGFRISLPKSLTGVEPRSVREVQSV